MAISRIFSRIVPAAALLATLAVAGVSQADAESASRSTASTAHHTSTLPPIVPIEALLGMSAGAGLLGLVASRRRA